MSTSESQNLPPFEQKVGQEEVDLTITDAIPIGIAVLAPEGTTLYMNRLALDQIGLTLHEVEDKGHLERSCHPDELDRILDERRMGLSKGVPFELEMRLLFKNGEYRWYVSQYKPLKDESGKIIRWYVTAIDIDDRKRAEQKLQQSEEDLRTITDTIRQPIVVLTSDGTMLYANRVALDNSGLTLGEVKGSFLMQASHPDDVERVLDERNVGLSKGIPFDSETRILFKNGQYRWQLLQYNPLKDESGKIIRWYVTATDINDHKKTEERLRNENLVLREEIDRSSMFEEIVGSSKPMRQLLKQVEKVAPADSTVLILGETGTGKELIARALHRRSKRVNRPFIRVNCAAIPQSLIASELFGHEKGAFTGALQRRVGRFEAANGGTLFLDEIGELPMETQIALLRVLQEKEFERVGSNHPISVDVRVIAATNRDMPDAVSAGTFRQDLFFRLNVFPISVPSLRERVDDIPLLVEYFVARIAKEAGKTIRHIGKQTLEQLQAYHWPGNIRELQNVVERAVILSETDTFVVDESWLNAESEESSAKRGLSALDDREVEMIEAALAETHGRISGPSGAAAKLGIPRQTLESKIRRLGIDKYGQKPPASR
jgi:formate hydrogenlyase transcriptional activator